MMPALKVAAIACPAAARVEIEGSWGTLIVNRATGEIVGGEHCELDDSDEATGACGYRDITRFDPVNMKGAPGFDILDVGFWTDAGKYCAAVPRCQASGCGAHRPDTAQPCPACGSTLDTEAGLVEEWRGWCLEQSLECRSADEMLHQTLTADQRAYVSAFYLRWEAMEQIRALADAFAALVKKALASDLAEIKARNAIYDGAVCATHDFCDANMLMAEAFAATIGRPLLPDDGPMAEADAALWNAAWSIAKREHLTA